MPDCGSCTSCKDMIKFGGSGRSKQACSQRRYFCNEFPYGCHRFKMLMSIIPTGAQTWLYKKQMTLIQRMRMSMNGLPMVLI